MSKRISLLSALLVLSLCRTAPSFSNSVETEEQKSEAPAASLTSQVKKPDDSELKPATNVDLSDVVVETQPEPIASQADSPSSQSEASAQELSAEEKQQESLILLGAKVPPGTSTRLAWSPEVGFMGVSAPTPVLVVNGVTPGPTLCLTAAVHGDESNGIETVRRVLYGIDAEKLSGAVIGVPIVNLAGFRAGSRYLPDRRDLNRYFPGNRTGSAASRIASSFFREVVRQCDALIDLHTGSFGRTNINQLRADLSVPDVKALAEKMGRIVVVQSRGAKGTLRRAAMEIGIAAVTLEAGAPNVLDDDVIEESARSVRNAMSGLGLLKSRKWTRRSDAPTFYESRWIRASEGGFLISKVKLGATVKTDQLLGVVTNPITNQRSEIRSPFRGRVIGMSLNQVMQPGYAAYHLGTKPVFDEVEESADAQSTAVRDQEKSRQKTQAELAAESDQSDNSTSAAIEFSLDSDDDSDEDAEYGH
ncbi:MAG: succinylglutamate desuccinylase/aspartoacylase family protein [Pseudomonadota bacterium]